MARKDDRKLSLAAFLSSFGAHVQTWRAPGSLSNSYTNIDAYIEAAKTAEKGLFDFGFLADSTFITKDSTPFFLSRLEPISALGAVSATTKHLGLVGTMTTSFSEPFTTARQILSLDHVSHGRAGWNVVTGGLEGHARNHGGEKLYEHDLRYEMATEYLEVAKGLWESWEEDAFVRDKASGQYVDFSKMHTLNHTGKFYSVQGPLNLERSPQGQPVIFQAGKSGVGMELAARYADAVFSGDVADVPRAAKYYRDIKRLAASFGRNPNDILVYPYIFPILGGTEAEAERKFNEVCGWLSIDLAIKYLSRYFSFFDFSQFPLDEPLPDLGNLGKDSFQSSAENYLRMAREEKLTLRQLALRASNPTKQFVGTPEQLADRLQQLFDEEIVDGYILHEYAQGLGFNDFVEQVVPILQRRGIYKTEYAATTLRGNLGLPIPKNRYAKARATAPALGGVPA